MPLGRRGLCSLPDHTVEGMPALSPTMETGNLAGWSVEVGQEVSAGDVLAQIETDKATVDFECTDDGVVAKIFVEAGAQDVPVGTPLLVLVTEADDVAAFADFVPTSAAAAPAPAPAAAPAASAAAPAPAPAPPVVHTGEVKASPAARIIAARHGLNLAVVTASGPKNCITKSDVVAAVATMPAGGAAVAPQAAASPAPAASMPASTGNPKTEIPHYYLSVDLKVDTMVQSAELFAGEGYEGKFMEAFIVKACGVATKAVPAVNSMWMTDFTRQFNDVNIACRGSLAEYTIPCADAISIRAAAEAANTGTVEAATPTFTVDFLDELAFARGIVGQGQSCVLSVGPPRKEAVMVDGKLKSQTVLTATLSCDHRTVDGAVGATWLQEFRKVVETPAIMML